MNDRPRSISLHDGSSVENKSSFRVRGCLRLTAWKDNSLEVRTASAEETAGKVTRELSRFQDGHKNTFLEDKKIDTKIIAYSKRAVDLSHFTNTITLV